MLTLGGISLNGPPDVMTALGVLAVCWLPFTMLYVLSRRIEVPPRAPNQPKAWESKRRLKLNLLVGMVVASVLCWGLLLVETLRTLLS